MGAETRSEMADDLRNRGCEMADWTVIESITKKCQLMDKNDLQSRNTKYATPRKKLYTRKNYTPR